MAKLGKRKYPALYNKGTGVWFTGYASSRVETDSVNFHETDQLELQYVGFRRGMSASNIIMKDLYDNEYLMSMSGFDLLMRIVDSPAALLREEGLTNFDIMRKTSLTGNGVWFTGTFCQTKQGQNYFIEPVEVR